MHIGQQKPTNELWQYKDGNFCVQTWSHAAVSNFSLEIERSMTKVLEKCQMSHLFHAVYVYTQLLQNCLCYSRICL